MILNLKPGLIIAISLFTASLSVQAETPSMKSCAAMDDPVERLACYDTLAGRLPSDTAKEIGRSQPQLFFNLRINRDIFG